MQLQGTDEEVVQSLRRGDIEQAPVSEAERRLLEFVRTLTVHAYRTTAEDTQQLRECGWTDEQIAEAVYIAALFAMFNRVADAFGLTDPNYFALPPEQRPKSGPGKEMMSPQESAD